MKIASKIFKKFGFFVVLGLFAAVFVSEIQAADGQYNGIDRKEIDAAIVALRNIAQSSTLDGLVDRINKAPRGKMSFKICEEEIINRITKMIEKFSQILTDYRTWSEVKPSWRLFAVAKAKNPPVPEYPQYDELKKLQDDKSKLIKKQLFDNKESVFLKNLYELSGQITFNRKEIVGKNKEDLISFLNAIKKRVQRRIAWYMWANIYFPHKDYWKSPRKDWYNDKDDIIDDYYDELSAAEFNKK